MLFLKIILLLMIVLLLYLNISFTYRKRKLGKSLIKFGSLFNIQLVIILIFLFPIVSWLYNLYLGIYSRESLIALIIFSLALLEHIYNWIKKDKIAEEGIIHKRTIIKWNDIISYKWDDEREKLKIPFRNDYKILNIKYKNKILFFKKRIVSNIKFKLNKDKVEKIDEILQEKLPGKKE